MIWNLIRSIYGRSSLEIAHFVLIHLQTWLPQAILVLDWSISKNLLLWNCYAKMNKYLVERTYGRFCIKFPQSRMKGERHRLSPLSLYFFFYFDFEFWCFNVTFSNISAIMATSFSDGISRSTRREPPIMGKQLVNFITCGCESSAPFLKFTKLGENPRRIGDRLVWVVR